MGILARIFGTDEIIGKAADGVIAGADAMVLTDEERVRYHLEFLRAYEPFKLAQRLLAMTVGVPYVAIWVISALLYTGSILVDPCPPDKQCKARQIETASKELATMNNDTLGLPFAIILGFYFAGGAVEGIVEKRARLKK